MTDYEKLTLAQIADAARNSNPELGALGASLVNYYTGNIIANFEDHEGDQGSGAQTALFLASAREIVLELIRRVMELEASR